VTLPDMTTPLERFRSGGGAHGRLHRLFGAGPWTCAYCRQAVICSCDRNVYLVDGPIKVPGDHATLDHLVPRSRGGLDVPDNIVVACHRCNCSKGSKICPDEWIPRPDDATICEPGDWRTVRTAGLATLGLTVLLERLTVPTSAREIARWTNERPSTVRRTLALLDELGIARRDAKQGEPFEHRYRPAVLT
jgi:hypothetical protein